MYELTELEMQQINGGGAFLAYLIYALLGAAFYKLWKSKKVVFNLKGQFC